MKYVLPEGVETRSVLGWGSVEVYVQFVDDVLVHDCFEFPGKEVVIPWGLRRGESHVLIQWNL